MFKKLEFLIFFLTCSISKANVEYYCSPLSPNNYFAAITAEFEGNEASLTLYSDNKAGAPDRFIYSADRSIEGTTIFYTTDDSVLIIEPSEVLEDQNKIQGIYMIPQIRLDIPVICESYL